MKPRRRFRESEVIATLLHQGIVVPCFRCKFAFTQDDVKSGNIEREHIHERELDGADEPFNCRYSHKARPCHATVTHGTPATSAGSSRNRIAKATDPDRIRKFAVNKKPLDQVEDLGGGKCRGCGEFTSDCTCRKTERRTAFARSGRR